MRKLASIQEITKLMPIEGKDRIELALIQGWQVIVQKGQFNPGDYCVYVEIDSVMPERAEFEFLRSKDFRIKTMKMAGVISQGICFPLTILPHQENAIYELDDDVTDILGVKQYEPTMDIETHTVAKPAKKKYPRWLMRSKLFRRLVLGKKPSKCDFPDFISKTDETRIQNAPHFLKDKEPYIVTEKIDGCSATYALVRHKRFLLPDKFEYMVCSRNLRLPVKDNSIYWRVSDIYDVESTLRCMIGHRDWIAIQGECIGPKIQGNKYHAVLPEFFVFNVLTPHGRMNSVQASNMVGAYGLDHVPILHTGYTLPDTVEEMLAYAHGESTLYATLREGVVVRSQDGAKSFKAVDPEFLLKHGE